MVKSLQIVSIPRVKSNWATLKLKRKPSSFSDFCAVRLPGQARAGAAERRTVVDRRAVRLLFPRPMQGEADRLRLCDVRLGAPLDGGVDAALPRARGHPRAGLGAALRRLEHRLHRIRALPGTEQNRRFILKWKIIYRCDIIRLFGDRPRVY